MALTDGLPEHDSELKGRVTDLLGFLRELVVARSRPVQDVDKHESVCWIEGNEAHPVPEVVLAGEEILRAAKVHLQPAPAIPSLLRGWVYFEPANGSAKGSPGLRQLGPDPNRIEGTRDQIDLVDAPKIQKSYDTWSQVYSEWLERDRVLSRQHDLYEQLHGMRRALAEKPESIEVVLATGLLTLPSSASKNRVSIHLISQAATVEQDEATGAMVCRLLSEPARLEDSQLLTGQAAYDPTSATYLRQQFAESVSSAYCPEILPFLKDWAARALTVESDVGRLIMKSDGKVRAVDEVAQVHDAPAIVLRKRGPYALIQYYDKMLASAKDSQVPVPLGLAQLVDAIEPDERMDWLRRTGTASGASLAQDPLFPLPANPEQAQIIERLGHDSGVVVEGPPGTGKTHTIANLVCALLAQGQRVLVTSEKAQALRVLRDKLPPEMQELCVSITDIARGGSAELNRSVATLAARKSGYVAAEYEREIENLAQRRSQALAQRSEVLERIRSLREDETYVHAEVSDGFGGTAANITQHIKLREPDFGWFPGVARGSMPLSTAEMWELRNLLSVTSPDRQASLRKRLPDEDLPDVEHLVVLCQRVRDAPDLSAVDGSLTDLRHVSKADLGVISTECVAMGSALDAVTGPSTETWVRTTLDDLLSGRLRHLWQRVDQLDSIVANAVAADNAVGRARVEGGSPGASPGRAFRSWAEYLQQGGTVRKFFKSEQQKQVEPLLSAVTVDGSAPISVEAAWAATAHFDALYFLDSAVEVLDPLNIELSVTGVRAVRVADAQRTLDEIAAIKSCVARKNSLQGRFQQAGLRSPQMDSVEKVTKVAAVSREFVDYLQARTAREEIEKVAGALLEEFRHDRADEVDNLVTALLNADGPRLSRGAVVLAQARKIQHEERRLGELQAKLSSAAPDLARLLWRTPSEDSWDSRVETWPESWSWALARTWAWDRQDPSAEQRLGARLQELDDDLAGLTAKLAAGQAWRATLNRMSAREVQALQAYRDNVANVGKGTGKYAERFRQAARSAMVEAQGAVPAWVMPLQEVLGTIPPQQNSFDVIIVDEASQAELSSLFLMWLAPRVIVVGDDKQCTPSEVAGGALDAVFDRLENYLPDMPIHLRATLTPRSSVFSMLRTRFGHVIRLREHYRCMPEIITWSSQMFYRDAPLVPVRQFGADRLPPLRSTYVHGGYTEGSNALLRNPPEAEAILESIEACLSDPAYDDKTLGVVVLQGQAQVDVIRNELLRRLDPDVWDERRLRVGTPPDFQGDERNVIFLSMVVSPEQRFATLTRNEYQRRYNVAASRAQDQLWLFHSVTVDRLSPLDLRQSLLRYMTTVPTSAARAMPEGVTRDRRHSDFDSLFEQRVFLDLVARGYHVTPQEEVNSRRIDLVVTGASSKLAVECDGDAWHSSPEQITADLAREVELKRCGWEFWRVRESEYYMDQQRSLDSLWSTLDDRGIGPFAADPVLVQSQVMDSWSPTPLPDDESGSDADDFQSDDGNGGSIIERAMGEADNPPRSEVNSDRLFEESGTHAQGARLHDMFNVITAMAASEPLTRLSIEERLGIGTPEARRVVDEMLASGRLIRRGRAGGSFYALPDAHLDEEAVPEVVGAAQFLADRYREQVRQLASGGSISNSILRESLDIDASEATRILNVLVNEETLVRRGAKRGSYYVLSDGQELFAQDDN